MPVASLDQCLRKDTNDVPSRLLIPFIVLSFDTCVIDYGNALEKIRYV